jgi:16S rRNA (cytosine1402-N4)-methyltransferase
VPDHADEGAQEASRLHRPVLLGEVLEHLRVVPGARVLDCTLGMGGHAEAILDAGASVVGVDRDPRARELASARLGRFGDRFTATGGTYAEAVERFAAAGERFAGVLADLGVSSLQLDDPSRGFGIAAEAAADMRMGEGCPETALDLIDRLSEDQLADVIYQYGEDRLSRRIARGIKRARAEGRIASAADLAAAVRSAVPGHQPRHPALRTFQALRIVVNDELGQLHRLLARLPEVLAPGGRAVVISFHSLEDRAVKESFRDGRRAGTYADASRKVVTAGEDELASNRRSGSAKLRWAEKAA